MLLVYIGFFVLVIRKKKQPRQHSNFNKFLVVIGRVTMQFRLCLGFLRVSYFVRFPTLSVPHIPYHTSLDDC